MLAGERGKHTHTQTPSPSLKEAGRRRQARAAGRIVQGSHSQCWQKYIYTQCQQQPFSAQRCSSSSSSAPSVCVIGVDVSGEDAMRVKVTPLLSPSEAVVVVVVGTGGTEKRADDQAV